MLYNISSRKSVFVPILGGLRMVKKLRINEEDPNKYNETAVKQKEFVLNVDNPETKAALEESLRQLKNPSAGYTNLRDFWRDLLD